MAPTAPSVLEEFARRGTRAWSLERVSLPAGLIPVLWSLFVVDALVVLWMYAVGTDRIGCDSALCSLTVLGGHELPLGIGAAGSAVVLLVLAPFTSALRRAAMPAVAASYLVILTSVVVAAGLVLAGLVVVTALAVIGAVVVAVVAGITS